MLCLIYVIDAKFLPREFNNLEISKRKDLHDYILVFPYKNNYFIAQLNSARKNIWAVLQENVRFTIKKNLAHIKDKSVRYFTKLTVSV